ncbi:hypothetical protein CBL_07971 [Carabus blaptoides fortunei]
MLYNLYLSITRCRLLILGASSCNCRVNIAKCTDILYSGHGYENWSHTRRPAVKTPKGGDKQMENRGISFRELFEYIDSYKASYTECMHNKVALEVMGETELVQCFSITGTLLLGTWLGNFTASNKFPPGQKTPTALCSSMLYVVPCILYMLSALRVALEKLDVQQHMCKDLRTSQFIVQHTEITKATRTEKHIIEFHAVPKSQKAQS